MTRSEKQAATLRANKQKQKEREAAQRAEHKAIHAVLVQIVNDVTASTSDKLRAAELLLQGN